VTKSERVAKVLGWMIVGGILAATAALIAGIGVLVKMDPDAPTPHSAEDEPPAGADDIGEQPEERSLRDEPELQEPSWEDQPDSGPSEPTA
jgi:hypothetical protein